MNELQNSQQQSLQQTLQDNFKASLVLAFQRVGVPVNDMDFIILNIVNHFKNIKEAELKEAIKKGSLGYFGINHKVNVQVVSYWILENRKSKSLGI